MSGSVRVARTGWGTGGHPGARSRAPLHPTATRADVTAPMTHRSPKRATIASRATPTAATTSPQTEPVAFGIDTSTPAATASATNQPRTTSARPPITRSHPRTVLAGIPNRAPISRCPPPAALATNAAQIRSATYALRSSNVTGNNTCVTAHRRHRDRRGRTGCAIPATRRTRAKPHPANTPSEHDGHDTSPAANRDSTRAESTSTVTISAFRTTHGAPEISGKNSAGAPCTHQFLDTLTVQTTNLKPGVIPATTSAPLPTAQSPVVVIGRDGQQKVPLLEGGDQARTFLILKNHGFVEPGETVSDDVLLNLGRDPTVALVEAELWWRLPRWWWKDRSPAR